MPDSARIGDYRRQSTSATADPSRLRTGVTIEQLGDAVLVLPEARWATRTRRAASSPSGPSGPASPSSRASKVQHANAALELAARGVADTLITRAVLDALPYGDRLAAIALEPPLSETFAFIKRRNTRPSPATRALMTLAEQRLARLSST